MNDPIELEMTQRFEIEELKKRIAELSALLECVPHNHHAGPPLGIIVSSDCPRCAYEATKTK